MGLKWNITLNTLNSDNVKNGTFLLNRSAPCAYSESSAHFSVKNKHLLPLLELCLHKLRQLPGSELVPVPSCASTTELFTEFHSLIPVKTYSHWWGYPSVNNDLIWFMDSLLSLVIMHEKARNQIDSRAESAGLTIEKKITVNWGLFIRNHWETINEEVVYREKKK